MRFADPALFYWLVPAAGAITALWMLRARHERVRIASLYLWRRLASSVAPDAPWQRLKRSLLLILQLLAALLLIAALARPFVLASAPTARPLLLVVDTGATMRATDVPGGRLTQAQGLAARLGEQTLADGGEVALLSAGAEPALECAFTQDSGSLRSAIDGLAASDSPADLPGALAVAAPLAESRRGCRIVVLSDGAFDPLPAEEIPAGIQWEFDRVGTSAASNIGITDLGAAAMPDGRWGVTATVEGSDWTNAPGALATLLRNGKTADAQALKLTGGTQTVAFSPIGAAAGDKLAVRLDVPDDALASDNLAAVIVPDRRPARVLLASNTDPFLASGLRAVFPADYTVVSPDEFLSRWRAGSYDFVAPGSADPRGALPPGNLLTAASFGGASALVKGPISERTVALASLDSGSPVMDSVDASGVTVNGALSGSAAPWATALIGARRTVAVAAGEHDGRRCVSLAFAPAESNWTERVSFPIFLQNAASWLSGVGTGNIALPVAAGTVVSVRVPPGGEPLSVVRPDGGLFALSGSIGGGLVSLGPLTEAGEYRLSYGTHLMKPIEVSTINPETTRLASMAHPELDRPVPTAMPSRERPTDLSLYAAVLGLMLLLAEWTVYNRRAQ